MGRSLIQEIVVFVLDCDNVQRVDLLPEWVPGGKTEFSNMFAAYDALSEEMKWALEPLHMVHYSSQTLFEKQEDRSTIPLKLSNWGYLQVLPIDSRKTNRCQRGSC